jgi:hypothetical protein
MPWVLSDRLLEGGGVPLAYFALPSMPPPQMIEILRTSRPRRSANHSPTPHTGPTLQTCAYMLADEGGPVYGQ